MLERLIGWLRGPTRRPRVLLVTKRGECGLCTEAKAELAAAARDVPFDLAERAIEDDPELTAAHALEVPVVFVDGKKLFFGKVPPLLLRRALRNAASRTGP